MNLFQIEPVFFRNQAEFRKWFIENHTSEKELWVGYYKTSSKKESISYSESVDEAICFGWIDGIRKSIDNESYCNRFTPRRQKSIWSTVNISKAETLLKKGLMQPAGIESYNKSLTEKSGIYSYENVPSVLSEEFDLKFRINEKAWLFFNTLSPSLRKTLLHWVMGAKKDITRQSRLEKLINSCEAGKVL
jgi:uncharacterized protein YdeI (YjbR/CyaY-like superfamily)